MKFRFGSLRLWKFPAANAPCREGQLGVGDIFPSAAPVEVKMPARYITVPDAAAKTANDPKLDQTATPATRSPAAVEFSGRWCAPPLRRCLSSASGSAVWGHSVRRHGYCGYFRFRWAEVDTLCTLREPYHISRELRA